MSRCGTRFAISLDELRELANGDVLAICQKILPNGRTDGAYWSVGSVAGEPGKSLKVNLKGASRGYWNDFSAGQGGTIIDLVAQVQFNGRAGEAAEWLRRWLNLDDLDPDAMAKSKAKAAASAEQAEMKAREQAELNRRKAQNLYLSAVPYGGTPAETYLISRELDFRGAGLELPGAIRFHPQVYCAETGGKLPAMVASINALDGRYLGTHRTWLQPDGSGKATLVEAKKSIGKYAGGFIPLWKGKHRQSMKDLPEGTRIYVSEGIEDGLSVALTRPDERVIAGVSLSNIGGLELPLQCPVHLLGQRDTNQRAIDQFEKALARLQERGHDVFLAWPTVGYKDWNDVVRGVLQDPDGDRHGEDGDDGPGGSV
jgi:hypothetical protein